MNEEKRTERAVVTSLLASAKTQFLLHGYEKASLRKICAEAGVTTGALYFAFENKEALFDALVEPTVEQLDRVMEQLQTTIMEDNGEGFEADVFDDDLFRFLVENRDGLRLIMGHAEGSLYAGTGENVRRHVETFMAHYAAHVVGVELPEETVRILTNMYFSAISEFLSLEQDRETHMETANTLRAVMEAGFAAAVEQHRAEG